MTADQRLDQLEPLVSQTLAVADRHTAQLKQLVGLVLQQTEVSMQQSDNVQFALSELSDIKREVMELKGNQTVADTKFTAMDNKLDLILGLLNGNKE